MSGRLDERTEVQRPFDPRVPPTWARDLVIYEINPRTFTSPEGIGDGSGSGTFQSTIERLPYLRDLGVNGIWMAGHHLATTHFYGIWSVYAVLDPARIDPRLGTPDDLADLVGAAHAHGIRMFLDVISHGVLHDSPLVQEHPDWFTSSSWEMSDYDYTNPEFREWWAQLWVDYALRYDIDGFRVDVSMVDIAVWDEIVSRLAEQGKEVVVFPENDRYHFSQQDREGTDPNPVRGLHTADFQGIPRRISSAQISCHDYGWEALPGNHYYLKGSRARAAHGVLLGPYLPVLFTGEEFNADPTPLPDLTQGLYGDGGPGGWLYGNRIDWTQLDDPAKAAMLTDISLMLKLRRRHSRVLHADQAELVLATVPHDGATGLVPYAAGIPGDEAVILVCNDTTDDITVAIAVPTALGFTDGQFLMVDAVTGEAVALRAGRAQIKVAADRTPGGGFRLLHLVAS